MLDIPSKLFKNYLPHSFELENVREAVFDGGYSRSVQKCYLIIFVKFICFRK